MSMLLRDIAHAKLKCIFLCTCQTFIRDTLQDFHYKDEPAYRDPEYRDFRKSLKRWRYWQHDTEAWEELCYTDRGGEGFYCLRYYNGEPTYEWFFEDTVHK